MNPNQDKHPLLQLEDELGEAASDCIVSDGENIICKSCGKELDTGGGHSNSCLQVKMVNALTTIRAANDEIEQKKNLLKQAAAHIFSLVKIASRFTNRIDLLSDDAALWNSSDFVFKAGDLRSAKRVFTEIADNIKP